MRFACALLRFEVEHVKSALLDGEDEEDQNVEIDYRPVKQMLVGSLPLEAAWHFRPDLVDTAKGTQTAELLVDVKGHYPRPD